MSVVSIVWVNIVYLYIGTWSRSRLVLKDVTINVVNGKWSWSRLGLKIVAINVVTSACS